MKFLITLIFAATFTFSQQSFIFNSDVNSTAKQTSEQGTNRFIVNIVEYSFINGTSNIKTAHKFRCLGLLIDTQFVLTTAECVHQQSNQSVHIGVQFTTTSSSGPDRSVTFDNAIPLIHKDFKMEDKEKNNIALVHFNPNDITTDPPISEIFTPIKVGSIPKVADYCTIIGRDVHSLNPPNDRVFVIGPNSCYPKDGKQASCSIIDNPNDDVCKVQQGSPMICKDRELAGFVLHSSCIKEGKSTQLRYHNLNDFSKWIKETIEAGPATVKPVPDTATSFKGSMAMISLIVVYVLIK